MAKKAWDIEENQKNRRWYLRIEAGLAAGDYPDVAAIKARASELSVNPYELVSDASLEKGLSKAVALAGEEFSFPVGIEPTFDVRLSVTPDKTLATLYVRKSSDRKNPLDMKLISSAINASRLRGIDVEAVKAAISAFRDSPAMELPALELARGTPPARGPDRELKAFVDWLEAPEAGKTRKRLAEWAGSAPASSAEKSFPCASAERLALVDAGFLLYEISPAERGAPGKDVFGNEIPGLPGNDPFVQTIEGVSLGPLGFKADCAGVLIAAGEGNALRLRVVPYRDAKATVAVTSDNMTASLILEKEEGAGTPLTRELVAKAIGDSGIAGNVDETLVERTIREVRSTGKNAEIVILRGESPVLPGTSRITRLLDVDASSGPTCVLAGARILKIRKLKDGADGTDVFGRKIPSSQARPESEPEHDDTIAEEEADGETTFVSLASGDLTFSGNRYRVSRTREVVADVTDETGDVIFPGDLALTGSIGNGRAVKANGSLTVTGTAGASLVYGEESVVMNGGIKGAGRGTVWAKNDISLTFAENAKLLAGGDIEVDNYCFQCTVKTNGKLVMRGNPAVLLGGTVRASRGIEVFELGSEKTIRTSVSFGQNYLVSDQIEVSEREVLRIKEAVARLDAEMQKTSSTNPRIHELRRKKLDLLKRNDKLTVRIFTLKEQYETHVISRVRVENTVYPGVILESHGRYYEVRERRNHVTFFFDQKTGQIVCAPIEEADGDGAGQDRAPDGEPAAHPAIDKQE